MAVRNWPTYLLNGVPAKQRALLSSLAREQDVSVSDVVRGILCRHYALDCEPLSHRYEPERDRQSERLILRVQPELWRLMKQDTAGRYGAMRQLIQTTIDQALEAP